MTSIGVKPTVSKDNIPLAETHIIGFNGDLYGKTVKVSLKDYVRPEKKFSSVEELKEAMLNNIKNCSLW